MKAVMTSALTLALAASVLAAPPVAPAPRPVPPPPVAPKVSDSFEVLVIAAPRPVRVRVAVLANGKPVGESWLAWQRRMFDFCDRNGDGTLTANEIRYAFGEQGRAQVLAGNVYQINPATAPALNKYDLDGDGKVTFNEFAATYTLAGMKLIRPLPLQPDFNNSGPITEAVFKLLDADGDGKLTKAEVRAVEKLLAARDADEDECLSVAELAPNVFNPNAGRLGRVTAVTPNGVYPSPNGAQMVHLYETGRVPGTVTQLVIKRYDRNDDFELTQAEIGFNDLQFKALDKDGNGRLDGEELDLWRTGVPDLDVTMSLAAKPADCSVKVNGVADAEARGFKLKQSESGRLVLHFGRQTIDLGTVAAMNGFQPALKQQFAGQFNAVAGGKDHILERDLGGPNAVQFQFVRVMFEPADRDADGKLTRAEFDAYFDLQDDLRNIGLSLNPVVQTPSLFELLDENRDGRLSVRELRTAWDRLLILEEPGAEAITKGVIQPAVTIRLSRMFDRGGSSVAVAPVAFRGGMPAVAAPAKGPLWFRKMDRNGDGDVSRAEFLGTKGEFDAIDTDRDDLLSLQEAEAWDKKAREK